MIELGVGELENAGVEALVNPVNTVGLMDNGPALKLKSAFPDNFNAYRRACMAGEVRVGHVFMFDLGATLPRYILNVAIKAHARSFSTTPNLDAGLTDLVAHVKRLGIQSIAVPALGCDLGGLAWRAVRPRIEAAFAPLRAVKVVLFAPDGA